MPFQNEEVQRKGESPEDMRGVGGGRREPVRING